MLRSLVAVGAALLVAGVVAPEAVAAPRGFDDCVEIAVGNGADWEVARSACGSDSLLGCYRVFRDEYGRQQWALDACKARTDE